MIALPLSALSPVIRPAAGRRDHLFDQPRPRHLDRDGAEVFVGLASFTAATRRMTWIAARYMKPRGSRRWGRTVMAFLGFLRGETWTDRLRAPK